MVGIVSLLMVSTWRYPSFKQISVSKPRTPLIVLILGVLSLVIWLLVATGAAGRLRLPMC